MHARFLGLGLVATGVCFLLSCVGEDPGASGSPDAGAGDGSSDATNTTDSNADADAGNDASADSGSSFDGGGPFAWYAGDDGLASDGGVTTWKDRSGHDRDLDSTGPVPAIATTAGKPSLKLTTPAGATNSCMKLASGSLVLPAARSIYAVGLLTRWTNGGKNYDSKVLNFGGGNTLGTAVVAGPSPRWIHGNVQFGYNSNATGEINTPKIFAVRDNGTTSLELTVSSNDQFKANTPTVGAYTGSATAGGFWIGCSPSIGELSQWDGTISEVILYDRRLTDPEHQAMIDYLKTRWNVAYP